jgi:hypothetical protein
VAFIADVAIHIIILISNPYPPYVQYGLSPQSLPSTYSIPPNQHFYPNPKQITDTHTGLPA